MYDVMRQSDRLGDIHRQCHHLQHHQYHHRGRLQSAVDQNAAAAYQHPHPTCQPHHHAYGLYGVYYSAAGFMIGSSGPGLMPAAAPRVVRGSREDDDYCWAEQVKWSQPAAAAAAVPWNERQRVLHRYAAGPSTLPPDLADPAAGSSCRPVISCGGSVAASTLGDAAAASGARARPSPAAVVGDSSSLQMPAVRHRRQHGDGSSSGAQSTVTSLADDDDDDGDDVDTLSVPASPRGATHLNHYSADAHSNHYGLNITIFSPPAQSL